MPPIDLEDAGYHVLGPIARGGMAEVLLAERIGPGGVRKRLAIKRLLPEVASDPDFVRLFENEARISVELDHANVVSVFELGEADGELFLAMEYVRGWDLAAVLDACARNRVSIPLDVALHVARETAAALTYAHEKTGDHGAPLHIVHRDVSPSNIMLSTDGAVKLADFGIARAAASAKSLTGLWHRAKIPYMSPEQANGEMIDAQSDLYSLGIVLYEMIAGRRLFGDDMAAARAARAKPIEPASRIRPNISGSETALLTAIDAVILQLLHPSKTDRYRRARDVASALTSLFAQTDTPNGTTAVRTFLGDLSLAPPVAPENVADGERTNPFQATSRPLAHGEATDTITVVNPPKPAPSASAPAPVAVANPPEDRRAADRESADPFVATALAIVPPSSLRAPTVASAIPSRAPPPAPRSNATLVGSAILIALVVFVASVLITKSIASPTAQPQSQTSAGVGNSSRSTMGSLEARSTPPGATVWIDGAQRGITPLFLEDLPRRITVVRIGFTEPTSKEHRLDLATSRDQTLDVDLR